MIRKIVLGALIAGGIAAAAGIFGLRKALAEAEAREEATTDAS
jgi:hypothetical protein